MPFIPQNPTSILTTSKELGNPYIELTLFKTGFKVLTSRFLITDVLNINIVFIIVLLFNFSCNHKMRTVLYPWSVNRRSLDRDDEFHYR